MSSFIQACTFKGNDCLNERYSRSNQKFLGRQKLFVCSLSYFHISHSASYGNCWTFNYFYNQDDVNRGRNSSMTGPFFGLSMVLNLEQKFYIGDSITKQAGARFSVQNPRITPLMDEMGNDLMPNSLTQAAMQEVIFEREKSPYPSDCYDSWTQTNYSDYIMDQWPYSLLQCQRVCTHSFVLMECGCFHPLFLDTEAKGDKPCDLASDSKYMI